MTIVPDRDQHSLTPFSIEALLGAGVRLLRGSSSSPQLDAELLLGHCLGVGRTDLFVRGAAVARPEQSARFFALVEARRAGQPVAQLVGQKEFWSLWLRITSEVLTPRPETELLVEQALQHLPPARPMRVLDLGTGSGAVALAIATERPRCEILATDISEAALAVAVANAQALGLGRVRFAAGNWFDAVAGQLFDLIVCNPPYVADGEWRVSDRELAFEPRVALAAGADGLDAIRIIAAGAMTHLRPAGALLIEHGATQGQAVRELLSHAGFANITTYDDLAGRPRVCECTRPT